MASPGLTNVATVSDMEEQHEEGGGETTQTVEERASAGSKTSTVEEIHTVGERQETTPVGEYKVSEDFVSPASISAVAMEEIAETIAASDRVGVDLDYSVAATLGSSVDGESVKTEDFAEEEAFIEESSKKAEVDFADLAAADEDIEDKTGGIFGESTETTEGLKQVNGTSTTTEIKKAAVMELEMDCSVAAALKSSVDVDSVLSLDDVCESTNVEGSETTDGSGEDKTLKSAEGPGDFEASSALIRVGAAESDVDAAPSKLVVEETSVVMPAEIDSTHKVESVIEEAFQDVMITETKAVAETKQCVTTVAVDATSDSSEADMSDVILTEVSGGFHASTNSSESASAISETATEKLECEVGILEKTPPTIFSSMMTRFAEKLPSKTGPHRTDSAAKLELNSPSPVENIVHCLEVPETVSPQTHRTPSAAKLDLSGSSPVKDVVHRLEAHQEKDNALESLKIRTKRDFFSEKGRSISVSHEKEKYNAQMAQRTKKEAEAKEQRKSPAKKHSPVSQKSSAMSSVRNMASRFEKKADQSLDNLSFRTVRSFFPTEKSIHVGAEKQKYEALEKEKQSTKEAEEKLAKRIYQEPRINSDVATISTEIKESATEEPLAEDTAAHESPSMDDMPGPTESNETATLKANRTPEPHSRRHTVASRAESPNVRGIAHRFETKRANSVVSAPVRTINTFIVADSEASVRVLAEKAKYENQVKTSAPTKRTIDTFIVPESEASVHVSTEKAKFETPEKLVKATVRTIDTFIVPDSETSVRVSAEKAKFESPEQQTRLTGPVVRTIDTFIVPENEVSVRVSAEKAKLEALEKQKQSELEAQAAIVKQKLERSISLALKKAKLEEANQSTEVVKTVEGVTIADEVKKVEVVEEIEMAEKTEEITVKEIEVTKEPEVASQNEATLETRLAPETGLAPEIEVVMQTEIGEMNVAAGTVMTEEAEAVFEIGVGKVKENDVIKVTEVAKPTEVATGTKKAKEIEETNESEVATERTDEIKKTEAKMAKVLEVVETEMKAGVAKEMASDSEEVKMTELAADIEVASGTKLKQTAVKDTEVTQLAEEIEKTEVKENVEVKEAEGASKAEEVEETKEDNKTNGAAVVEEASQTEVVKEKDVIKVPKESEMAELVEEIDIAKEATEMTAAGEVKESEVVTLIKEAKVADDVGDTVQESKEAEGITLVKEIEAVTKMEKATECEVAMTTRVEEVKVVSETASEEEQEVQNLPNLPIPVVEVTVERQTFGDIVSTTQHAHWLSLPVSVNPALARLHTVLSDHDPLTAYALYPSSPPSRSSWSR